MPVTPYTRQPDGQVRLLTKVARMYHERGVRQADIATALNISQAKVSRLLKRAESVGIVRTIVTVAPGVHAELEEQLEEKYGCLLYTSPSPRDGLLSRMPSSA